MVCMSKPQYGNKNDKTITINKDKERKTMKILIINAGSSSLKYQFMESEGGERQLFFRKFF